ncbi:MAG: oxygen-independent coproporphyrinogen-3 oxidase [Verrucomicrobia bacterium]|jgi:oxygen-independent coproporphyrinogen III oxidase|nr:MAG: oxygen-independent coproporphyrinogen-3 oxidase [Verrucomicrobiota bacterium]
MSTEVTSPEAGETTAGNYFVANYPPFHFWDKGTAQHLEELLSKPAAKETPLGVYFHIPFCRKRCHFCYFRVYTERSAGEIQRYLDAGMAELERYAGAPFVNGRKPKFIYFGGGTPSYLSVKQLRSVTDRMKELLSWDEVEEVTFEAEPGTLNEGKLQAIRELGVTRLSLGVENFDSHILEINGRAHRADEIQRAYKAARDAGFPQINIDLISGMVEETEDNWRENIRKLIELEPDCVTIYQMEVPYNTGIFKQMKAEGKLVAPVANWATKRAWTGYAFAELEKAGYTVTSGYTAVRDPERTKFVYRDSLWKGADLIGAGVSAFSHIGGVHFQNMTEIEQYIDTVTGGNLPVLRAMATTPEERLIRELILQLKLGRVQAAYFQQKFGVDVKSRFALQWQGLEQETLGQWTGGQFDLTREALLKVDSLLHPFFLPQHQNSRYA